MSVIFRNRVCPDEEGFRYRVMSTFSGIGAASISWDSNLFEFVAYAEPAAFPAHVLHYRRGAGRPRYMPDPEQAGLSEPEREQRLFDVKNVVDLPETGTVNWGDITQITDDDLATLGKVHVLEGGSPCQAFSFAGKRRGLNDHRGNVLLAFCLLAERMRKINELEFVVWENVHGVFKDDTNGFGCLLASLAGETGGPLEPPGKRWSNAGRVFGRQKRQVAWRTVDAVHWGIPQRRKRVFLVANIGGTHKGFGIPDQILFEPESSLWHPKQGLKTRQAVCSTYRRGDRLEYRSAERRLRDSKVIARLDAEASKDWIGKGLPENAAFALDMKSQPAASGQAYALTARNESNPQVVAYALADDYAPKASKDTAFALMAGSPTGGGHRQMIVQKVVHPREAGSGAGTEGTAGNAAETDSAAVTEPVTKTSPIIVGVQNSGTLYARGAQPAGVSSEQNFLVITKDEEDTPPEQWTVRRFTPLECERLQAFPDYWTDVPFRGELVADGHRYKAIGNSMPCPVMSFIGDALHAHMDMMHTVQYDPDVLRRKRGRPTKGQRAMTATERQRRRREQLRGQDEGSTVRKPPLDYHTKMGLLSHVADLRELIGRPSVDVEFRLAILADAIDKLGAARPVY
ncbi:DNA cytosine methyltransferase [Mesorhizobium sp. B2-4-19]|uniref:DNA (cytosine-5-)-methyltransferase n=1 Tax=Mesorhizobium sp. B2-4-19 TaxID=2589930 RepID=UPI00112B159E|nr:DNA (cytosine-5-)-methyltransferase [Mesorhizobium sp. B2-4-19]TPK65518.1 DNA cytosine methyltransferase [Mesorhizobium sp. B2-4-19]